MAVQQQSYETLKNELKTLIIPMIEKISLDHYDSRALSTLIKTISKYSTAITCSICQISKPRKHFNDGHLNCKGCITNTNYHKEYYKKNKEALKAKKQKKQDIEIPI
jgi:hypothetical protein